MKRMRIEGTKVYIQFEDNKGSIGNTVIIYTENTELTQSIEEIIEEDNGMLWALCLGECGKVYATQINFCPFTGKEAKVKREDYR